MASETGRQIVEMIWADRCPRDVLTRAAFENALVALMALGGSTNAIIHLLAMARRAEVPLVLDDFDFRNSPVPVLADIRPSGKYLMEDFFYAGGLAALLTEVTDRLHLQVLGVNGKTLGQNIATAKRVGDDVIRARDNPVYAAAGLAIVRGNLAPDGAVIKCAAASDALLRHTGKAVVFEGLQDMQDRIDSPALDVDENSVLVLRNAGPIGGPGMPEWGMLPIPKKLLEKGVRDVVRISDARMSGTHYGTVVLHVSPEAAAGGTLRLVQTGDLIALDVAAGRLDLLVNEDELSARAAAMPEQTHTSTRGWRKIFSDHVMQAHEGCDLDLLGGHDDAFEPEIN